MDGELSGGREPVDGRGHVGGGRRGGEGKGKAKRKGNPKKKVRERAREMLKNIFIAPRKR